MNVLTLGALSLLLSGLPACGDQMVEYPLADASNPNPSPADAGDPPTIIATNPANTATNVSINRKVTATFSRAMNPATITGASFTVQHAGVDVEGIVTYTGNTATFTGAMRGWTNRCHRCIRRPDRAARSAAWIPRAPAKVARFRGGSAVSDQRMNNASPARTALPLHWKMAIGFVAGLLVGMVAHYGFGADAPWVQWLTTWVTQPAATLFLRLIFMLVIPLLFSALVVGIAEMGDIRALGRRHE